MNPRNSTKPFQAVVRGNDNISSSEFALVESSGESAEKAAKDAFEVRARASKRINEMIDEGLSGPRVPKTVAREKLKIEIDPIQKNK